MNYQVLFRLVQDSVLFPSEPFSLKQLEILVPELVSFRFLPL